MQLITTTTTPLAAYPPASPGVKIWRPSRQLRNRLRTPERLTVSAWADKYRRVTEIDSNPGAWRNDLVPHLIKPMDTIGAPYVREVWICAPERAGKTQLLLNTVCWGIDQGANSGNIFWLMPTEADARRAVGERIIPVIKAKDGYGKPGRLSRYLTGYADDTTRGMIRFNHGIRLFPAWSNSPASIASYFGRINIADECDKFAERTSEGTDPITLFKKRARDDRHRSKYVFASTPAGKYIYRGATEAHQVWQYHLRCPDCDALINPDGSHLVFDDNASIEQVERHGCQLACPDCGSILDDDQRRAAYHNGRWECIKGSDNTRPQTVGFHMTAFCLPGIPLAEIGAAWLTAQQGDLSARIAWSNGYMAEDFDHATSEKLDIPALAERRESYASQVPAEAGFITAGCDVQGDRIEVEVIAWGLGLESYGLDYRQIFGDTSLPDVWNELDAYLQQTWQHSSGTQLRIACTCIDSGFRAPNVYAYTHNKRYRGIVAIKGASTANHPLVRGPNNIRHGRIKVPVASIGTDEGKRLLFDHLQREQPGPGYCHFPEHYPDSYFRMLGAEEYQEKRSGGRIVGEWVKVAQRNESIDLRVYNYAALTIAAPNLEKLIADLNRPVVIEEQKQPSIIEQRKQARRPSKGGFVTGWK